MLYGPASYKENYRTADGKNVTMSLQIESNFPENGNSILTLKTSRTAFFPLALRVPSWCSSFIAEVGGKEYNGTNLQYLVIKRLWKSGEKIKVSFKIPVQILNGGKSYPGQIAFQRGPQILAFDNSLNIDLLKNNQFKSAQRLLVERPGNKSDAALLPKQWIGKQAYSLNIIDKGVKTTNLQLIMVPFADASQTGGDIKVWMPLEVSSQ